MREELDALFISHFVNADRWHNDDGEALPAITISIGVAEYLDGETLDTLIERADQALYQAKQQGRNRVVGDG